MELQRMAAERKIRRITLRDVARSCNLSVPTVSQILNNRASNFSSEETRRLVRETAERLGYQPNLGYKLMRGISTKTVALVIGHANMKDFEYIRKFIFLILERLSSEGYSVYIETMPDGWSKRQRHDIMLNLIQRGAEHFISIGKPCEWEDLDALEQRTGITMMTFSSEYRNSVNVNVEKGELYSGFDLAYSEVPKDVLRKNLRDDSWILFHHTPLIPSRSMAENYR